MKTNIPPFLIVLVSLLVISGAGCTSKAKRAYHEHRADKYFAAEKFDQAEIEYLNVLRNDNQNAKAFGRLGTIYFLEGRYQTASPFLNKAVSLATNDLDLRYKLGMIYANFGRFKDAQDSAIYILGKDPKFPDAPELLADMSFTQKDIDATRAKIQGLIQNGDRADYEIALATLAFHEHDLKTTEADLKRALVLDAKSAAAFQALGTLYASENDVTNAGVNFKAASDASPPRSPRRMLYSLFKLRNGDAAGARQILDDIIQRAPDYMPALMGMAEISLVLTNNDAAQSYLNQALARDPDNFEALMFQGRLDIYLHQFDKGVADMERLTKLYPQSSPAYDQLGLAYLNAGDYSKATLALNRALDLDPNSSDAQILLAQAQIHSNNPDMVILAMSKLAQKQPQLEDAQLLLASAYAMRGRYDDALQTYITMESRFPNDPRLPLYTGVTYLRLGNHAEARKAFERARRLFPNNFPALEQLVNLDLMDGDPATALQLVQEDIQKNPTSIALHLLEAKVLLAQNKVAEVETVLAKASQMNTTNSEPDLLLAQLYLNTGERAKAQTTLNTAFKKNPKDISGFMLGAAMSEQYKEYQKAADYYEQALAINPQFGSALNNLAYLYSEQLGKLDRAYDLAQTARNLAPNDPFTADTLGWIDIKRGSYSVALGLLRESATALPTQSEVQYHYGLANYLTDNEIAARAAFRVALQNTNQFTGRDECETYLAILNINPQTAGPDARAKLEKRVADKPDDSIALGRLAAIYQRDGLADKATATYESVLKADPKNLTAMVNLALLYGAQDPAKGLAMAKSANGLAPNDTHIDSILGWLAYQTGDFKLAATQLRMAVQGQPDNAQVQYEFALASYNIGDTTDAQSAAQNALNLNLAAPQSASARQLLDMLNLAANPTQAVAASGRVDSLLKTFPNYAPALFVQAVIKLQAPDTTGAADACEKILSQLPDFSPAQRLLAIIYSSNPQKNARAYELAMKARDAYPNDNDLAKAIGIIVYQQGDYSRAARLLNDCASSSTSDPEIFYYLGSAQAQLKSPAAKSNLQHALSLNLSGPLADNAHKLLATLK